MAIAVLLVFSLLATAAAWSVPAPSFQGDGTVYDLGNTAGNCNYESVQPVGVSSFKQLPFATGIDVFAALNGPQYANVSSCGQCLTYRGLGAGSGTVPIASTPQYAMIADRCGECKVGDLDLNQNGDGRWAIEWTPLECAVGDSKFQFAFEGSNPFYLKVKVLNGRVPTSGMSAMVKGAMVTMTPTQDNAFLLTEGGPFSFPLQVQLTSIQGAMVMDTLPTGPTGVVQGSAQYPPSGLGQVVTTPGSGASVQGVEQGQVQTCNITLEAFSACGGINVGAGDAPIPGACYPDGFVCVRQNAFYWQVVEEAESTSNPSPEEVVLPPIPAPGGYGMLPMQASAGQEAPGPQAPALVQSAESSPSIVCQLVQELLDMQSLADTCAWQLRS